MTWIEIEKPRSAWFFDVYGDVKWASAGFPCISYSKLEKHVKKMYICINTLAARVIDIGNCTFAGSAN
ncbi:hypothetical protein A8709_17565 [Paenibacillus pectinilyticus]|uniref:Uncharacterized protein n=1 Tax=Paenibacillus pectinilyticus TaxID=512399 RepID=A0A1C0ZZ89_9BACL|nr:hypothetical protein [Paenibacillus pectinilyticus]OCT13419.1 hypothetical protein A8709_17565 [Paenibacillus pectinilyticus]